MRYITLYSIIIIFIFCLDSFAQNKMKGPFKKSSINQSEIYGSGKNQVLNFYQNWISPVKGGDNCPMFPSCSQYAKISFDILPWYKAYPRSMARILRCGHELHHYSKLKLKNRIHWYDPVTDRESKNGNKKISDIY